MTKPLNDRPFVPFDINLHGTGQREMLFRDQTISLLDLHCLAGYLARPSALGRRQQAGAGNAIPHEELSLARFFAEGFLNASDTGQTVQVQVIQKVQVALLFGLKSNDFASLAHHLGKQNTIETNICPDVEDHIPSLEEIDHQVQHGTLPDFHCLENPQLPIVANVEPAGYAPHLDGQDSPGGARPVVIPTPENLAKT